MLRLALTYQLILAVAMGPLLCCCSAGKSLAGSPSANSTQPAHVPTERVSHSCCSHKPAPAKSDSGHKSSPSKPTQPAGKCPCKEGGDKQVTQVEPAKTSVSTFLRIFLLDAIVLFVSPVTPETLTVADLDDASRLGRFTSPTGEILDAHHNLRC